MTITVTPVLLALLGLVLPALGVFGYWLVTIKQSLRQHRGHAATLYGPEDVNGVRRHRRGLVARVEQLEQHCELALAEDTGQHRALMVSADSDPPESGG
jgi:hypothetical protein